MTNFAQLQTALARVWPALPAILGEAMNDFEARLLVLLRALEASPADPARMDDFLSFLEDEYPRVYERLVEEMAAEGQPVAFRSTSLAVKPIVGRYMLVPVWYATDRKNTGAKAPADRYSGERGALQFGRVEVSIPDSHEKGKLEKPRLFRLEFRADPEKHVILSAVNEMGAEAWKSDIREKLDSKGDVLLFIHGYNVGFADASRRAAQFAHDLNFEGLVVLYSWPSEGAAIKYTFDEDNASWTVDDFEEVLLTLMTETGAKTVHAVAHSMGNRVLTEGLRRIDTASLPAGAARLREVVFAAPDINADTFRKFVEKFHARAERFTLYVSSGDKALEVSQKVHKYPRAGDAGDSVVCCAGLETIDASAVDSSLLGHSYFCENGSVIQDLIELIKNGLGAGTPRPGLKEQTTPAGRYWALTR